MPQGITIIGQLQWTAGWLVLLLMVVSSGSDGGVHVHVETDEKGS